MKKVYEFFKDNVTYVEYGRSGLRYGREYCVLFQPVFHRWSFRADGPAQKIIKNMI